MYYWYLLTTPGAISPGQVLYNTSHQSTPPSSIIIFYCINLLMPRNHSDPTSSAPCAKTLTFLPPTMDDIPFFFLTFLFVILFAIYAPPHLTLHIHPSSLYRLRWPTNSLRPLFRPYSLHASVIVYPFFPVGFGIPFTVTLQANIINTNSTYKSQRRGCSSNGRS